MNRSRIVMRVWMLLALGVYGCNPSVDALGLGHTEDSVIYGSDDRVEALEYPLPEVRDVATRSVGAFFYQSQVKWEANATTVDVSTRTLRDQLGVCDQVRFSDQPTGAQCSGVVISDDLVITAGHCLGHDAETVSKTCQALLFAFGFLLDTQGQELPIAAEQVYACRSVIAHAYDPDDASSGDFAVLRLDRRLGPHHPPIPIAAGVEVGSPIIAIGNGAGLPTKISGNAAILELLEELPFLRARTDSFAGGSGSAITNVDLELVAVQSRGQSDWTWDKVRRCYDMAVDDTGFESHQLASFAVARLCEAAPCAAAQLCYGNDVDGWQQRCGTEPLSTSTCGDQACSLEERRTCTKDCAPVARVPWGWACQASNYGTGDGCHCSCGVIDADCMDPSAEVKDCGGLETCGSCVGLARNPDRSTSSCSVGWGHGSRAWQWVLAGIFAWVFLETWRSARRRSLHTRSGHKWSATRQSPEPKAK